MDIKIVCSTKKKHSFKRKKESREASDGQISAACLAAGTEGPKPRERASGKVHRGTRINITKPPDKAPQVNNSSGSSAPFGDPPAHCCLFRLGKRRPPGSSAKQRIKEREGGESEPLLSTCPSSPGRPQTWGGRSDTRDRQRRLPSPLAPQPRLPLHPRAPRPGGQARGAHTPEPAARGSIVNKPRGPSPSSGHSRVSGGRPRTATLARTHEHTHGHAHAPTHM